VTNDPREAEPEARRRDAREDERAPPRAFAQQQDERGRQQEVRDERPGVCALDAKPGVPDASHSAARRAGESPPRPVT
jgi:hypothetical protein